MVEKELRNIVNSGLKLVDSVQVLILELTKLFLSFLFLLFFLSLGIRDSFSGWDWGEDKLLYTYRF